MRPTLAQPIYIKLIPSKLMLGLVIGVSLISSVILLCLPISVGTKCAIIALILVSSTYYILRDSLLSLPWSWQVIAVDSKGQLKLSNQRGEEFKPTLAASSFVHANLTILNFKSFNFKSATFWRALPPVILFTNTQNADEMRQLRVWLRWSKHSKLSQEDSADALGT